MDAALRGKECQRLRTTTLGIQQKLWGGVVLDASYVGTQSHHMGISPFNSSPGLNLNQLDPKYLALGTVLQSSVGSAQANAAGITAPYAGFVGTVAQALRPYPQYQTITFTDDPVGNQHYNALQMKAQKTLSSGVSMILAYTYEKNITDVNSYGAQNYYDCKSEKAVASFDIPQSLVGAYTYELPIGKGKLLGFNNSLANKLLGGWTTSGSLTFQSGKPINVMTELSLPGIGAILPNVVAGQPLHGPNASRGSFNPSVDKLYKCRRVCFSCPIHIWKRTKVLRLAPSLWDGGLGRRATEEVPDHGAHQLQSQR